MEQGYFGIFWALGYGLVGLGEDGLMLDFTNLLRALSSTCQKTYCGWLQVMELDPAESSHDKHVFVHSCFLETYQKF